MPWLFMDFRFYLFISPALLLMVWAQWRIRSAYAAGMKIPTRISGAEAARAILDAAGLVQIGIEPVQGQLSDHYDPRAQMLRLSTEVYQSRSAAAVGIAAHEAGHALQHATGYMPLVVRNAAVPAAQWGPQIAIVLLIVGAIINSAGLMLLGIIGYGCLLAFQVVNLPVEFDASNRAKRLVSELGYVDATGNAAVRNVLNAAAWTYVAATLQTLLTILYWLMRLNSRRD